MRLPDALTPLREPRFAWFYAARVTSTAGSTMAPIALAFAVLDLTGSASALGLVLAARTIPMVLFLLLGGVVSDRFSRTTVVRTSNLLSALTQGTVAYLVISGHAELWMLIALEAANGTVSAFTMPAMEGIVPQIAPRTHLQQANALLSFSRAGLTVVGPTVAALLVAGVGLGLGARLRRAELAGGRAAAHPGDASRRARRSRGREHAPRAARGLVGVHRATPGCGWWWPASG